MVSIFDQGSHNSAYGYDSGAPKPRQVLDGESLVKLFRNPNAKLQRDAIFQHFPGYLGAGADTWRTTPVSLVQIGDWKLMEFLEDGRLELYNLGNDLGETKNLANENPAKAKELHLIAILAPAQ